VLRQAAPGFVRGHLRPFPIVAEAVYGLQDAKKAYDAVSASSRHRVILVPTAS